MSMPEVVWVKLTLEPPALAVTMVCVKLRLKSVAPRNWLLDIPFASVVVVRPLESEPWPLRLQVTGWPATGWPCPLRTTTTIGFCGILFWRVTWPSPETIDINWADTVPAVSKESRKIPGNNLLEKCIMTSLFLCYANRQLGIRTRG